MRKFTKLLFALALTIVAVGGAKAEQVYKIDYSTYTGFPFYVMGYVPEWVGGVMTDYGADYKYQQKSEADAGGVDVSEAVIVETNDGTKYYRWITGGGWHQYNMASDIPLVVGGSYKVKALVKASAAVDIDIEMRWSWEGDYPATTTRVTIPQSDEFVEVEWEHKNVGAASAGLTAKPGNSKVKIEWKSLTVSTGDPQYRPVYGDLREVTPHIYAKNAGESYGELASPDVKGEYTVTSVDNAGAADWDTQFWIATPEKGLPVGQKFYVEFSYKADHAATVTTQTQLEENGGYKTWHCVGEGESKSDFTFTADWKSIKKEVTIEDDMGGWKSIAFNLNCDKTANTYYFKDIVLKVPELTGEYVDALVGPSGWATYNSEHDVNLGAASGYAAKYNGSYVVLTPVTEVPANNAILLEGAAGKYTFNVIASASAIADNDLKISDGSITGNGSIYALANYDPYGVGFYKVKTGKKIPAGKPYLDISSPSAPDFLGFDGGAASISELNVKGQAEGTYFNLAGQRVAQPTKGLYIVNGKKVVIK